MKQSVMLKTKSSLAHNAPAALGTKARITAFPQSRVLPEAAGALPKTGIVSVLGNVTAMCSSGFEIQNLK